MGSNIKSWRWCKGCKQWVLAYPLGVGQWCDQCWADWSNAPKDYQEAKEAADYLLRDYSVGAI